MHKVMQMEDVPESERRAVFIEYAQTRLGLQEPYLNALKEAIETVDDHFFTAAASSSGKYHPASSLGVGGLVRHTIVVANIAVALLPMYGIETREGRGRVILASLLHDAWKCCNEQGVWETHSNVSAHGRIGAKMFLEACGTRVAPVAEAIRYHMSRWGDEPMPYIAITEPEGMVVAMADYIASRKALSFEVA